MDKKYIFILNNQGKGAILTRPGQFGYPPKIAIPNKIPDAPVSKKEYFNTGVIRYSNESPTGESMIYTERNCQLNIQDYVGKKPEPVVEEEDDSLKKYDVYITYKETRVVKGIEATSKEEAEELAYDMADEAEPYGEDDYEYEVELAE